MLAGLWQHRDLVEGVFTFEDLLDAHELLDMRSENERRAREHAELLNKHHGH